jgi:hypothetical protein
MDEATLRKVLWADVVGSGTSVVFSIAGAGLIADWIGAAAWIPLAVGVLLIPWVWFLYRTVRRNPLRPTEVAIVVAGNVGWAVAAAVLILGFPDALSTGGKWIVGIFSLAVLDFGLAQWVGLRRLHSDLRSAGVRMTP